MPQYARPSADTYRGNFTDQNGGTTNIYTAIDDVTTNDTDYIQSPASPTNEVYVCKLSAVTAPGTTSNHVMQMRTSVDKDNQEAITFTQQLRQGYVSESNQGTLIASQTRSGVTSTAWVDSTYTLTAAEAGSITNYADLYYRFIVTK